MKICELDIRTLKDVVTLKKEKKSDANFSRMPTSSLISLSALLYGTIDDSLRKRSAMVLKADSLYSRRKTVKEFRLTDVNVHKVIGVSKFSKIFLVELKETKDVYALKIIRKDAILLLDLMTCIQLEKKILNSIEHPFIMALSNSIQTEQHICFLMPFVAGGDLFEYLKKNVLDENT
jgi:serine/threonine protein kinase